MGSPVSKGRMIRRDISRSRKYSSLSKEAMILFTMLIPHFNSHGKMNGSPHFVKGEVVPLIDWFTLPIIERSLKEISDKTSVKWFQSEGLWYLHSVNWTEHQELRKDRLGNDDMPDYSGTTPGLLPPEVEVEEEDKDGKFVDDFFETIWKAYPVKEGKKEAQRHYNASVKTKRDCHLINYALAEYLRRVEGKDQQYIKHGGTWFNNWKDYIPAEAEEWVKEDMANEQ